MQHNEENCIHLLIDRGYNVTAARPRKRSKQLVAAAPAPAPVPVKKKKNEKKKSRKSKKKSKKKSRKSPMVWRRLIRAGKPVEKASDLLNPFSEYWKLRTNLFKNTLLENTFIGTDGREYKANPNLKGVTWKLTARGKKTPKNQTTIDEVVEHVKRIVQRENPDGWQKDIRYRLVQAAKNKEWIDVDDYSTDVIAVGYDPRIAQGKFYVKLSLDWWKFGEEYRYISYDSSTKRMSVDLSNHKWRAEDDFVY